MAKPTMAGASLAYFARLRPVNGRFCPIGPVASPCRWPAITKLTYDFARSGYASVARLRHRQGRSLASVAKRQGCRRSGHVSQDGADPTVLAKQGSDRGSLVKEASKSFAMYFTYNTFTKHTVVCSEANQIL